MAEVALELALEDLHRGRFDVVFDALELELASLRVVDGVARAVVVVARLTDRADAHDVLPSVAQRELARRELFYFARSQREDFAKVRMADQRDVAELADHR